MAAQLLKEGDIIDLNETHTVYGMMPAYAVYSNSKSSEMVKTEIKLSEMQGLIGRYVVVNTSTTGGGTGHGAHDVYPDGHLVKCKSLDDCGTEVSFYQTGCFTAMIEDIAPVNVETVIKDQVNSDKDLMMDAMIEVINNHAIKDTAFADGHDFMYCHYCNVENLSMARKVGNANARLFHEKNCLVIRGIAYMKLNAPEA